jgi:hypothetical protein
MTSNGNNTGDKTMNVNWDNGSANIAWSQIDPSCNSVDVVKATDKAVQLKTGNYTAWFPKVAFKADKYGTAYEVQAWFKSKMTSYQKKAIGFAT